MNPPGAIPMTGCRSPGLMRQSLQRKATVSAPALAWRLFEIARARAVLCKVAMLRMDLGFRSAPLLAGLEVRRRRRSDRWRPSTTWPVCAPTPRSVGWLRPT